MARTEVQTASAEELIVRLRAKGWAFSKIAEEARSQGHNLSAGDVSALAARAADKCRSRSKQMIDEAWMIHQAREETLWAVLIEPQLDGIREAHAKGLVLPFDRDLAVCAIKIMERQAKRMGLDAKPAEKTNEWMTEKPDDELKELAKAYNIDLEVLALTGASVDSEVAARRAEVL